MQAYLDKIVTSGMGLWSNKVKEVVTKASDEASDYLLSQLVYMVGQMTKKAQTEFLNGLINAKQEMR